MQKEWTWRRFRLNSVTVTLQRHQIFTHISSNPPRKVREESPLWLIKLRKMGKKMTKTRMKKTLETLKFQGFDWRRERDLKTFVPYIPLYSFILPCQNVEIPRKLKIAEVLAITRKASFWKNGQKVGKMTNKKPSRNSLSQTSVWLARGTEGRLTNRHKFIIIYVLTSKSALALFCPKGAV